MKESRREELAEEFLRSIGKFVRGMNAIFRKEIEKYQVTWPQFYLMKAVKNAGGMTVTEVSNRMMVSAPTASRMIDGLCAKGLLEKAKDSDDHRITQVLPTPESEELVVTLTALQHRLMLDIFRREKESDLERTVGHLSDITDRWLEVGREEMKRSSGE